MKLSTKLLALTTLAGFAGSAIAAEIEGGGATTVAAPMSSKLRSNAAFSVLPRSTNPNRLSAFSPSAIASASWCSVMKTPRSQIP